MHDNEGGAQPAIDVVREFWRLMSTNDFESVGQVLAPDFVLEWPQSKERIRGAEHFARVNAEYPAHGPWRFTINPLVGGEVEAVTDVVLPDTLLDALQSPTARSIALWNSGLTRIRHRRIGVTSQRPSIE